MGTQQEKKTVVEKLIIKFSEDAVDIFGDKKCKNINIPCLQLLANQVRST